MNEIDVENNELAEIVVKIMNKIESINKINILKQDVISYSLAENIVKNGNVKLISCYSIPEYIVENLDKYNVKIESRSELFLIVI